jgi:hypothetical protein
MDLVTGVSACTTRVTNADRVRHLVAGRGRHSTALDIDGEAGDAEIDRSFMATDALGGAPVALGRVRSLASRPVPRRGISRVPSCEARWPTAAVSEGVAVDASASPSPSAPRPAALVSASARR